MWSTSFSDFSEFRRVLSCNNGKILGNFNEQFPKKGTTQSSPSSSKQKYFSKSGSVTFKVSCKWLETIEQILRYAKLDWWNSGQTLVIKNASRYPRLKMWIQNVHTLTLQNFKWAASISCIVISHHITPHSSFLYITRYVKITVRLLK